MRRIVRRCLFTLRQFIVKITPRRVRRIVGPILFHYYLKWNALFSHLRLNAFFSSRFIEYPWTLRNLHLSKGRVLDVGCSGTLFSYELIMRGLDVYGIDVRDYPTKHPSLKFYQTDVRSNPFPDDFFNRIVAVSTIEHIGLGAYGEPKYNKGDLIVMTELKRILKKNGKILITLPFADRHYDLRSYRIYDERTLDHLTGNLLVEEEDFFIRTRWGWFKVPKEEAKKKSSFQDPALVCLILSKGPLLSPSDKDRREKPWESRC